jgi:hypothetical protein
MTNCYWGGVIQVILVANACSVLATPKKFSRAFFSFQLWRKVLYHKKNFFVKYFLKKIFLSPGKILLKIA